MAFLRSQHESDDNDSTKDFWFTDKGPFGVSGFNLNGKEVGGCLVIESSTGIENDPDNLFLSDYCKVCSVDLITAHQAESHYMSEKHQKKVRTFFLVKVGAKQPGNMQGGSQIRSKMEACSTCQIDFLSSIDAHAHYKGKKHAKKLKEELSKEFVDKTLWRRCPICDIRVNSVQQLEIHMLSPKHKIMGHKRNIFMVGKTEVAEQGINAEHTSGDEKDEISFKKQKLPMPEKGEKTKKNKLKNNLCEEGVKRVIQVTECDTSNVGDDKTINLCVEEIISKIENA